MNLHHVACTIFYGLLLFALTLPGCHRGDCTNHPVFVGVSNADNTAIALATARVVPACKGSRDPSIPALSLFGQHPFESGSLARLAKTGVPQCGVPGGRWRSSHQRTCDWRVVDHALAAHGMSLCADLAWGRNTRTWAGSSANLDGNHT